MAITYTKIFHGKTLQNLLKEEFFGLKICHLATLFPIDSIFCRENLFNKGQQQEKLVLTELESMP
jgi:hypothetical protein